MSRFEHYSRGIAESYDQTISHLFGGDLSIYIGLIETLLQQTEFHPEDTVIELAAGTGIATAQILRRPGHALYITDHSRDMLQLAQLQILDLGDGYTSDGWELRERILDQDHDIAFSSFTYHRAYEKNIIFLILDAYDVADAPDLENITVNKMVLSNAFLSFSDPAKVLKAAYRRLAEGGELIFNCKLKLRPGEKSLRDVINDLLLEEGKRRKDLNLPGLLIHSDNTDIAPRYSRKHIEKMVEEAGFGVCFTEEKDVHLWPGAALKYLQYARERVEKATAGVSDSRYHDLKIKISNRLFLHPNMPFNLPTLLRREGFFVAKK